MGNLERIKELVGGEVEVRVPSVDNIKTSLEKTEKIIENAKKIRKTLEAIKDAGINSVLNLDFKNKRIRLHGRQFLILAQAGYGINVIRGTRSYKARLEENTVKVVGNLDRKLAQDIIKEMKKFKFKDTDIKARDIDEMISGLKKVPADSIEYHFQRGDFRRWLGRVLKRGDLVREIDQVDEELKGKELKKTILEILKNE